MINFVWHEKMQFFLFNINGSVHRSMIQPIATHTWLRPVTTCVCKPEAADTVRAPDDERRTARNMLKHGDRP
jgi:hypothetical protein